MMHVSHSVMPSHGFFATPWTVARQASLSMGILQARILKWLPCPPPGDLPNPEITLRSPALKVDSLLSEPPRKHIYMDYYSAIKRKEILSFVTKWMDFKGIVLSDKRENQCMISILHRILKKI